MELRTVPIDSLEPNPDNPNTEDPQTFNELAQALKETGITEPLIVVQTGEESYRIVSGEHRWKAAKLAGWTEMPVVIADWDDDKQLVEMVKINVTRGKLDPDKFTRLWNKLKERYGEDVLKRMMGLSRKENELRRLLKQVKRQLPEDMARELGERADKIRNIEDLAAVVNSLYTRYGSTLQYSYVLFQFGGKTHLMVRLDDEGMKTVEAFARSCSDRGIDINKALVEQLRGTK